MSYYDFSYDDVSGFKFRKAKRMKARNNYAFNYLELNDEEVQAYQIGRDKTLRTKFYEIMRAETTRNEFFSECDMRFVNSVFKLDFGSFADWRVKKSINSFGREDFKVSFLGVDAINVIKPPKITLTLPALSAEQLATRYCMAASQKYKNVLAKAWLQHQDNSDLLKRKDMSFLALGNDEHLDTLAQQKWIKDLIKGSLYNSLYECDTIVGL